jgi:hypothetical protein
MGSIHGNTAASQTRFLRGGLDPSKVIFFLGSKLELARFFDFIPIPQFREMGVPGIVLGRAQGLAVLDVLEHVLFTRLKGAVKAVGTNSELKRHSASP